MAEQETEEPSIEEILSSIRQIISDDDDEGEDDSAPAEEKVMDYSEDVKTRDSDLDLSPEDEEGRDSDLDLSAEEESARKSDLDLSSDDDIIELTEAIDDEPEDEPDAADIEVDLQDVEPEPEPKPEARKVVSDDHEDSFETVLSQKARAAAMEGFESLAKKTAIEHNGITVEDIVRTELNPLLRDWLDRNLPSIIERLVQEELEKIAKRATEND